MNIILWILFGGIAGWVATLLMGQDPAIGIVGNIIIGILGAFLGGWIADSVGAGGDQGAEQPTTFLSFVWAVIGAIILLFIINFLF